MYDDGQPNATAGFRIQREHRLRSLQRCLLFKYEAILTAAVFSEERFKSLGDLRIRNTVLTV